jgi:hypothetical protein
MKLAIVTDAWRAWAALELDRDGCRRAVQGLTWERASAQFLSHLVHVRDDGNLRAVGS